MCCTTSAHAMQLISSIGEMSAVFSPWPIEEFGEECDGRPDSACTGVFHGRFSGARLQCNSSPYRGSTVITMTLEIALSLRNLILNSSAPGVYRGEKRILIAYLPGV